jgi:hypothetical protein
MWIALAVATGVWVGWEWAPVVLIALPLLAYLGLRVFEALDDVVGRMRGAVHAELETRRRALVEEFTAIAEEMESSARPAASRSR